MNSAISPMNGCSAAVILVWMSGICVQVTAEFYKFEIKYSQANRTIPCCVSNMSKNDQIVTSA